MKEYSQAVTKAGRRCTKDNVGSKFLVTHPPAMGKPMHSVPAYWFSISFLLGHQCGGPHRL